MKKYILLLFLFLFTATASGQLCTVSGTLTNYNLTGTQIRGGMLKEVRRSGYILPYKDMTINISPNGAFRFQVPESVGTDTTKIRVYFPAPGWTGTNEQGVWVPVTHGAAMTLNTQVSAPYVATAWPIGFPLVTFYDSTGAVGYRSDTLRLGSGLIVIAPTNGGDTPTLQAIATGGGGGSDSTKIAYDTLAAHRVQIDTKQSVLSSAQIARLDSSLAAGYAISITSQGTIQVIAVDTAGFFAAFGGVMTETDPTAIKADTASLAVHGDQMYPRTAGTPVDTAKFVSMDRDDAIKGEKAFGGDLQRTGVFHAKADSITAYKPTTFLNSLTLDAPNDADETQLSFGAGFLAPGSLYLRFYGPSHAATTLRRQSRLEAVYGMMFTPGTNYGVGFYAQTSSSVTDLTTHRKAFMDTRGKWRIGDNANSANSLEISGNFKMPEDSTADLGIVRTPAIIDSAGALNPNGSQLAAIVTAGAGDSVTVTITGVLPTDVITVSYIGGTTAATVVPWSNVFAANTLTIYGTNTRKLAYIRIRK